MAFDGPCEDTLPKTNMTGWKIPMFNRKYIDKNLWWIFQPSHVSFREGIFAKFWVLEKGVYLLSTHGNLGYQFVKFRRDSAWTPRVAPGAECREITVPNRAGLGSCYSDPWSFIIHISHIWKTRWPPCNRGGKIRFLATKKNMVFSSWLWNNFRRHQPSRKVPRIWINHI